MGTAALGCEPRSPALHFPIPDSAITRSSQLRNPPLPIHPRHHDRPCSLLHRLLFSLCTLDALNFVEAVTHGYVWRQESNVHLPGIDRKSTRLHSSHVSIAYSV